MELENYVVSYINVFTLLEYCSRINYLLPFTHESLLYTRHSLPKWPISPDIKLYVAG
jgi:hypothetical protein